MTISTTADAVRYASLLLVWMALFAVRPRLAFSVMHDRRADSRRPRLQNRTLDGYALPGRI